jgi:hypothetical protein
MELNSEQIEVLVLRCLNGLDVKTTKLVANNLKNQLLIVDRDKTVLDDKLQHGIPESIADAFYSELEGE